MRRRTTLILIATLLLTLAGASPAQASTTFNPVADTYVDASSPTSNYGLRAYTRTDASPARTSYLRFDVQGVTDFSSARLRVFVETGSNTGFDVRSVASTTWSETATNYNNAPSAGAAIWSSGPVNSGTWVTADVSGLVSANGLVSLALTTPSSTAIRFTSREGANRPELIVPAPPSASQFVVSRTGSTYQAVSTTPPITYSGALASVVMSAVGELNQSGGGTVTFGTGTFDLGADWLDLHDIFDIVFEGQGIDATVLQNSTSVAADTEPFDFSGATRVTIRDMTIIAGGAARTTSDAIDFDRGNDSLVERVKITGSRGRGIVFDGKNAGWSANNNVVRDCVISGVPSDGIELLASSNNVIEGCTIANTGGHGIQVTKSSTSAAQANKKSNDNIVLGNVVDNAGQDGINVNSSDRNRIDGNTVTNSSNTTSGRDGIRINSSDSITCDDNIVENNLATDNQAVKTQSYGLHIQSALCNRTLVRDNNFAGNRLGEIRNLGTGTQIVSNDTQDPDPAPVLAAGTAAPFSVPLTWTASADNVGVTGYTVYRDGQELQTVGGTTLAHTDATVVPDTTYTYTVDAFDAAGNRSVLSNAVQVTTPGPPSGVVLNPVADSYVKADSPASNYGSSTSMRADASPDVRSYLRFVVTGASRGITSAKLRVYANSSSSVGHEIRSVADNTWTESGLIYTNAPAVGGVIGTSGPFSGGNYIEVDISTFVTGNGTYNLALTTPGTTAISYASRESANRPELVLQLAP